MTRPVKQAPAASANGKPRPVGVAAWKVRKAILAIPATELSSAGKVLLSVVADYAGYGQSTCWATNESLALDSGLRERQVRHLLNGRKQSKTSLISKGWLTATWKTTRKGDNAHRDLALGPKTLEWIERSLPRLDTKFRTRPSMDWEEQLCHPREEQLCHPREEQLCHQNSPSLELPHRKQSSSSSSTPPPRGRKRPEDDDDDVRFASQKSGGSKQKAKPLSDDEGLEMVCRVASSCLKLPGAAARFQAATDLGLRIGHDWRLLAAAIVRLDAKVAAGDAKPRNVVALAVALLPEMRSMDFPSAELDALDAKVERLLKGASPSRPGKQPAPQPRPDHAAAIAELERDLARLEADVASAPNRAAKHYAQRALDQAHKELATLETEARAAP